MSATVRELNQHFIDLWWDCDTRLPDLGPLYTSHAHTQNEKHLLQFLEAVDRALSNPPRGRAEAQSLQVSLGAAFRSLAEEAMGFRAEELDLLPSQAFSEVSEEFVHKARAFDPKLSGEDIYQAGRNAWTANGLQWLLGLPVQNTPSIFAYSLLYPYTDNYLDDPAISVAAKRAFNERFRRRLAGELLEPANAQEQVIFDLVAMIEGQYSRADHPAVFESLLDIHHAQGRSLDLLRRAAAPGEVDVLGLSFAKGGTSVLADGHLVSVSLDEPQRRFMYGHGIFAQLLDDMEDVEQDSQAGRLTVYSQPGGHWPLDALANRTFHFGREVLMRLDCFDVEESLRELIRRGADLLLIDTIGRTERYYTPGYLRELEAHSPFRFSILKEGRNDFANGRRHGSLVKLMETVTSMPLRAHSLRSA
ncbi:MAG: hypothetical protein EHM40_20635 [Chloroflexi bacterium]|nr:MAG: hypothetical protein EHM40_20635 [Chloroflexota bacterium]